MERKTTPRTLADLGALSEAEAQVVAEIDTGEEIVLGDGTLPEGPDPARRVLAALIRMLLLPRDGDGLPRLHEKGLRVRGASIPDALDLEGCRIGCELALYACRFEARPVLRSATLDGLYLNGSSLPGLAGDRLSVRGGLFLRRVTARGEVRLLGMKLGGDLSCVGATFEAEKDVEGTPGDAFSADGLDAAGKVVLRGVTARGAVRLPGAKLGGDLDCEGATFTAEKDARGTPGYAFSADGLDAAGKVVLEGVTARGEVRLLGAHLGGDLDCEGATFEGPEHEVPGGSNARALNLGGARVKRRLLLRAGARVAGVLDLTDAEIGAICDDRDAWPSPGGLLLDRCRYGAFTGGAPVEAAARIEWLGLMEPARWGDDFWPQPYEQCAKVLREMGHSEDARAVLIAKERLQRAARRARAEPGWRRVLAVRDAVLDHTIRFGQQPLRAFLWLGVFWAVGFYIFGLAATQDALKPSSPVVLRSAEWVLCGVATDATVRFGPEGTELAGRAAPGQSQRACFRKQPEAASYPGFLALTYSLDTILPIASLQQQEFWIPDETKPHGAFARVYLWVHIAVGWALSLLAVAGFSGLVKSD